MKRDDLFEQLEPPRGGLAKLRERMTTEQPSWTARRFVPMAATLAIAAAVILFFWSRRAPDLVAAARQRGGPEQIALGLAPPLAASAALTDEERATTALAEVRTSNPKVAFYWVSSTAD